MKEFYQPKSIRPESIIDLRPKLKQRRELWRELLAVRLIIFIIHLVWLILSGLAKLFYRTLRLLGLLIINLFVGVKNLPVEIKSFSSSFKKVKPILEKETEELVEQKITKPQPWFRLLNFALLLCLIILPFVLYRGWRALEPVRQSIMENTSQAFKGLFLAKDSLEKQNLSEAKTSFEVASNDFLLAQNNLKQINQSLLDLAGLLPNEKFKLASASKHILTAGELAARLGADLSSAVNVNGEFKLNNFLDHFITTAIPATDEATSLVNELNKINLESLPAEYREQFSKLRQQASLLAPSLKESVDLAEQLSVFLGKQYDKRYLLVFQNNAEKRASGGFLGSFAVVDLSRGELKNLTVPKGGSYDTEAGLYKRILAPEPLWLVNPQWHFWDANWWPDFAMTAKKLEWFYEKSNGPTVDGVISLTPTVIEKLLAIHGPVDMTKEYGVTITADNFWLTTQTFSEQKPNVTKEPKKIIGDLMAKLLEDLPKNLDANKTLAMISMLEKSLNEKQIIFYFNDAGLEKTVERFGWDGQIKKTTGDYLLVTSTNIGGQKSDRAIKETINHDTQILPDGSIIDNLTIERAHTATKNQPFVGFRNVSWLRVYVPEGSELISASGFNQPDKIFFKTPDKNLETDPDLANEQAATIDPNTLTKIYQEKDKTVFANWSMVDPGQTAVIKLSYRLPFKAQLTASKLNWWDKIKSYFKVETLPHYSLLVQKQAGEIDTTLKSSLTLAQGWQVVWQSPKDLQTTPQGWQITTPLDTDFLATVLYNFKQ